ncbi:MAG TPA: hypothetical protein VN901_00625 [Candidatus Acidoferrales bacterium]|nr:hypothetical protein [Candidatus Acidoferrales bacterium]
MTTSGSQAQAALRKKNVMDGRSGFCLRADWGSVSVLEGGGHICDLNLNACPGMNPLWRPPWETIDPSQYATAEHARTYGKPPDARLLAGIAGHSLSFDHFGPPSPEETAAGLTTHGEAPALNWDVQQHAKSPRPYLQYGLTLHEARIRFRRKLTLDRRNPVIYCEEEAVNLCSYDRPISWNEHVTFGPPFLEAGITWFDMPATRAKVCPASYSSRFFLRPDAEFSWPNAPTRERKRMNLRTTPALRFGHYTAQLLNPKLEIAFIAACNPRLKLLVVYVFRRADFPWVGNWEERHNRTQAPWLGKTFCRGLEFSTTPFAIPRRETIEQGPMFGEPTYRWLPAKSKAQVRFLILLFEVPETFRGVARVSVGKRRIDVVESGVRCRTLSVAADKFL